MALHTLGSTSSSALRALAGWSAALLPADVAAIGQSVSPDAAFASVLSGFGAGATGVLATGSTHSSTTLDTLVTSAGAPLSQIKVGDLALGVGIPPGTYVAALLSSTSVQLSKAASASASGVYVAFLRSPIPGLELATGILTFPGGRGRIQLHPGDVVAIDNTGWPIVVSGAAISYLGSQWAFT